MKAFTRLFVLSTTMLGSHAQSVIITNHSNEEAFITLNSGALGRNEPSITIYGMESMKRPYGRTCHLAPGATDVFELDTKQLDAIQNHFVKYPKGKITMSLSVSYTTEERNWDGTKWWSSHGSWHCDAFTIHAPFDPDSLKDIVIEVSDEKGMMTRPNGQKSALRPTPLQGTRPLSEWVAMSNAQAALEK